MSKMPGDGTDKLKDIAPQNLLPELKKGIANARLYARRVAVDITSEVSMLNTFTPAKQHTGEKRTITIHDRSKRAYRFTVNSNGRDWGVLGYSIHPCLNFIHALFPTESDFQKGVTLAFEMQKKHLVFHKKLIDIHPIIGTCILLGRSIISRILNKNPALLTDLRLEYAHPTQWIESHLSLAEKSLNSIHSTFSALKERTSDTLTRSFLSDVQKECELLIVECCFFSFLLLDFTVKMMRHKDYTVPCVLKESAFSISPKEYAELEQDIMRLRSLYLEYVREDLGDLFPLPNRKNIIETGEIYLPSYVSIDDIEAILNQYAILWDSAAQGLSHNHAYPVKFGRAKIHNDMEIGIQSGSNNSEDRLSFRMPGFNIRIDKDMRHNMMTLDIGGVSLRHALSCAEEFLSTTQFDKKTPSLFKKESYADNQKVLLENKMALLAAVLMNASYPIGLRRKKTFSHHSREFVARDDYFNNFSNILAHIKEGLERPQK